MKRLLVCISFCFCLSSIWITSASAQGFAIGDQSEETQKEAVNSVAEFLTLWLVDQDIEQASRYFALDWYGFNNVRNEYGISREQIPDWSKKILVLLLEKRKDAISHAVDEARIQNVRFAVLPTDATKVRNRIKAAKFQDAINPEETTQIFFGKAFVLTFKLRHSSRGDVTLVFEKINGDWKIVNFLLR
jgi:hypothetical protein